VLTRGWEMESMRALRRCTWEAAFFMPSPARSPHFAQPFMNLRRQDAAVPVVPLFRLDKKGFRKEVAYGRELGIKGCFNGPSR
jgi:hypothetical protein